MSSSDDNLIWLDMEMSGLNTEADKVLELATIVTDPHLNIIAEGPVIVIHQAEEVLSGRGSIKWYGCMESIYPLKIRFD